MFRYQCAIIIFCGIIQLTVSGSCGGWGRRISDPKSCTRYRECVEGEWEIIDCPFGTGFNGRACRKSAPCTIGVPKSATILKQNHVNTGEYLDRSMSLLSPKYSFNNSIRHRRRQTPKKSFKHNTTKSISGRRITTLWYFNSNGTNFKLSIYGGLPAPREKMIDWLEKNSHNYRRTIVAKTDELGTNTPDTRPTAPETTTVNVVTTNPTKNRPNTTLLKLTTSKPTTAAEVNPLLFRKNEPKTNNSASLFTKPTEEVTTEAIRETVEAGSFLPTTDECGLAGEALANRYADLKITGGKPTPIQRSPWQAAILKKFTKELDCGGSIVSSRHVVSAAHCFRFAIEESSNNTTYLENVDRLIGAGTDNLNDYYSEFPIEGVFYHAEYDSNSPTKKNDIALIVIKGDFVFGGTIFPICVPVHKERFSPGRVCKISGFGKVTNNAKYTEIRLRSAEVRITTVEECRANNNKGARVIDKGMVCAGNFKEGGIDTCKGDSGGPLACQDNQGNYRLFGVTSWGIGCGDAGFPGVYTKVTEYVQWIRNRIDASMGVIDRSALTPEDDTVRHEEVDIPTAYDDDYDAKDVL